MFIKSTDQLGNILEIQFPPKRIASLVPSQTELLFDLNLDEQIVGVTRFCIHPKDKVESKTKIGGTKKFNIERIKQLKPDLIIGNKEENYREGIETLCKDFPVWMSDIFTLKDSFNMMNELGRITNRETDAKKLVHEIEQSFEGLSLKANGQSCAYFIWRKPYMVAAGSTFIDEMIKTIGLTNVFSNLQRYPEIVPETLAPLNLDYIFLSSEPYSFSEKHLDEFQAFSPASKVVLVDGEMFSWYGSRLRFAPAYFSNLLKNVMM